MPKLKKAVTVETAFASYLLTESIGEGGAGRVYGATGPDEASFAIKVLARDRLTADRRRRFKNETAFLLQNKHPNIVSVTDHGVANDTAISGPFYVMRRYDASLRDLMTRGIAPTEVLSIFAKILDGAEAAHLKGAVHRDLKPENILFDTATKTPALADFGIASFNDDIVATAVETKPTQRLANFQYAAPEQRVLGRQVGITADIYALGLILNELFTRSVPHGTEYQPISAVNKDFGYLDAVVAKMIRQNPTDRYETIAQVRAAIAHYFAEYESAQKLSKLDETVIPTGEIDDPLALHPPRIVGVNWDNGTLIITLDQEVHSEWVTALQNMGSHTSVMGIGPERFQFIRNEARVAAGESDAQRVIDYFKDWLPRATLKLRATLQSKIDQERRVLTEKLRHERAAEEQRLRVNRALRF